MGAGLSYLRARLIGQDDSGPFQTIEVEAGPGQHFTRVMRPQPFGLSASPPADSQGLLLYRDGQRENPLALGFEHPSHRPTDLPAGATALYDAAGGVISIVNKNIRIVAGEYRITAATIVLDAMVYLGGDDAARKVALDQDPVTGAKVQASATRVRAK